MLKYLMDYPTQTFSKKWTPSSSGILLKHFSPIKLISADVPLIDLHLVRDNLVEVICNHNDGNTTFYLMQNPLLRSVINIFCGTISDRDPQIPSLLVRHNEITCARPNSSQKGSVTGYIFKGGLIGMPEIIYDHEGNFISIADTCDLKVKTINVHKTSWSLKNMSARMWLAFDQSLEHFMPDTARILH
jgi:hypothetical protein